jgi:hypothetical protein
MPSADFCPITPYITVRGAPTKCGRKVGQISPGKSMILPCTTAAFTSPHFLQTGFVMLCLLTQEFGLICGFCPSAHRFALRLLSDARSPLRPCLRLVLFKVDKFATFLENVQGTYTPQDHAHAGHTQSSRLDCEQLVQIPIIILLSLSFY